MKKLKKISILAAAALLLPAAAFAVNVTVPSAPGANYVLISNSAGTYNPYATSSLGIAGNAGTVTSVAASTPTGLSVSGSPVTTSGTLAFALTPGYIIPTTASTTLYDSFYNTPSSRIIAGTNLSWAGNTLNASGSGGSSTPTSINGLSTSAFQFSTTSSGTDFSISTTTLGVFFNLPTSSASSRGALSSADWSTFNGKQAAGSYITALTGDVAASGPGSSAATLATVNSNVGSFGSSTAIPSFTVNAKGLVTAASTNAVIAPAGTLTGTTLASSVVTSSLTTVGTIGSGTWQGTTVGVAYGGTGTSTAPSLGQVLLGNASGGYSLVATSSLGISGGGSSLTGATGQVAYFSGTNVAAGTSTLFITGEKVGLGTTTPASALSIVANAIGGLFVRTSTNIANAFTVHNASSTAVFNIDTTATESSMSVGTTSATTTLTVQSGSGLAPFTFLKSVGGVIYNLFRMDSFGHQITGGPAPAISSCGTSPTVVGDDTNGIITTSGTVTACTATFANAYPVTPVCTFELNKTGFTKGVTSVSTTAFTMTMSGSIGTGVIYYHCEAHQ